MSAIRRFSYWEVSVSGGFTVYSNFNMHTLTYTYLYNVRPVHLNGYFLLKFIIKIIIIQNIYYHRYIFILPISENYYDYHNDFF
jgi:hypothetical protein